MSELINKIKTFIINKKETIIIAILIIVLFFSVTIIYNLLTSYDIYSTLYFNDRLDENDLIIFRVLVIFYRIIIYLLLPIIAYYLNKVICRTFQTMKSSPISNFYSIEYIIIPITRILYIFFAFDIVRQHMIFASVDVYAPLAAFIVIKIFKQKFKDQKNIPKL